MFKHRLFRREFIRSNQDGGKRDIRSQIRTGIFNWEWLDDQKELFHISVEGVWGGV